MGAEQSSKAAVSPIPGSSRRSREQRRAKPGKNLKQAAFAPTRPLGCPIYGAVVHAFPDSGGVAAHCQIFASRLPSRWCVSSATYQQHTGVLSCPPQTTDAQPHRSGPRLLGRRIRARNVPAACRRCPKGTPLQPVEQKLLWGKLAWQQCICVASR